MTKIVLDSHATEKFKAALEADRLIQRAWTFGCKRCLLGTLVTEEELDNEWSYFAVMLHRGLSRDVINRITYDFDCITCDKIADFAIRFAKVAEHPVDYKAAIRESYSTGIPYIDALERQLGEESQ